MPIEKIVVVGAATMGPSSFRAGAVYRPGHTSPWDRASSLLLSALCALASGTDSNYLLSIALGHGQVPPWNRVKCANYFICVPWTRSGSAEPSEGTEQIFCVLHLDTVRFLPGTE